MTVAQDLVEHHQQVQKKIDDLKARVAELKEANRVKVLDYTNHVRALCTAECIVIEMVCAAGSAANRAGEGADRLAALVSATLLHQQSLAQ